MHWALGGITALENSTFLCTRHHHLVHEGDREVRRARDGTLVFTDPQGDEHVWPGPFDPDNYMRPKIA